MTINQNNRLSVFLMGGSLLLLLLFLCFWLKSVYEESYKSLQKDTDYLFSESIRAIEDEMLERWYGAPFSLNPMDSTGKAIIKINLDHKVDSVKTLAFFEQRIEKASADSAFNFTIRSKKKGENTKQLFGALALSKFLQNDTLILDSVSFNIGDSSILSNLKASVEKDIRIAGIPLNYRIIRLESETAVEGTFVSNTYTDLINGESYALQYDEYRPYLLRQMLPEILFSIFLFSCISLAFFVVYQSLQAQRKLARIKNDFVSNVTHELKTPITTVGVAIEALSDFEVLNNPERTKEYLNISKHELNRLSILVDKVLKMSLFEKKEPELKLEQLNINQLIQGILETMKLQFDKWNAVVSFKPLQKTTFIKGDKIHLTSVFYNLIDNALKYSAGKATINISLEEANQEVKLHIKDNGIGISPEYRDKIFEKFFRVPTGDTHNAKGYGLGLSYVTSVVKKHNGKIEVDSTPGEGTCFTVYLPQ